VAAGSATGVARAGATMASIERNFMIAFWKGQLEGLVETREDQDKVEVSKED
jgi:hypothetical protein